MSGLPSQRVKYAAMASAAVLIVGAGAAALIDNREAGIDTRCRAHELAECHGGHQHAQQHQHPRS